ncbi:MAG: hypothetical protein RPU52_09505, partial [Candidatus Sedimenticola sp. (ex Thyasira tokunagai)]
MELSITQDIYYSNKEKIPLSEVARSLLALEEVSRIAPDILEKLYEDVTVQSMSVFVDRCQPWRAKRRLVIPGSREAALLTRRARSAPEGKQSRHPNTASSHWE